MALKTFLFEFMISITVNIKNIRSIFQNPNCLQSKVGLKRLATVSNRINEAEIVGANTCFSLIATQRQKKLNFLISSFPPQLGPLGLAGSLYRYLNSINKLGLFEIGHSIIEPAK